jgi:hypothetical protein
VSTQVSLSPQCTPFSAKSVAEEPSELPLEPSAEEPVETPVEKVAEESAEDAPEGSAEDVPQGTALVTDDKIAKL